ncbi:MAG: DUF3332 family protein [Planctomycetota bacterium]|nr:DUF3332 family protein [Planctomycetota bacterium]
MTTHQFFRRALVCVLGAALLTSPGCYGSFKLTKKLYDWNGSIEDPWGQEAAFLVCVLVPAYFFSTLGDAIVFNSVEFWTGDNPVDAPAKAAEGDGGDGMTTTVRRGEYRAVLESRSSAEGRRLELRLFRGEQLLDESTLIQRPGGRLERRDADGRLLASGEILEDGTVLVRDFDCAEERVYSPLDVALRLGR